TARDTGGSGPLSRPLFRHPSRPIVETRAGDHRKAIELATAGESTHGERGGREAEDLRHPPRRKGRGGDDRRPLPGLRRDGLVARNYRPDPPTDREVGQRGPAEPESRSERGPDQGEPQRRWSDPTRAGRSG